MGKNEKIDSKQLLSGRMYALAVGEQRLKFDFRGVLAANSAALRLCSFNKDGMAYLAENDREDVWSLASLGKGQEECLGDVCATDAAGLARSLRRLLRWERRIEET